MSLAARQRRRKRIESLVENDPPIETVLSDEHLDEVLGHDREGHAVMNYLKRHFLEVVKIAVEDKETSSDREVITATRILTAPSLSLCTKWKTDPELVNSVVAYLGKGDKGCICLFSFMMSVMRRVGSEFLSLLKDPVDFYKNVLKHVPNPVAVDFLNSMFEQESENSVLEFLELIEADVLTLGLLQREEPVARCGLQVLRNIVAHTPKDKNAVKRMSAPDILAMLIDYGVNGATNEVTVRSFVLVNQIFAKVEYQKEVLEPVVKEAPRVAAYLMADGKFTPDKREAANIIMGLMRVEFLECAPELWEFLFKKSLEQKTNSFLHQTCLGLLRLIAEKDEEKFRAVVEHSKLAETLLELEQHRGKVEDIGYWGHVTQVGNLVFEKLGKDLSDPWKQYVTETLEPRLQVEAAPYGGEVPPIDSQMVQPDSFILDFLLLPFMHSSGEEEEEEEEEG